MTCSAPEQTLRSGPDAQVFQLPYDPKQTSCKQVQAALQKQAAQPGFFTPDAQGVRSECTVTGVAPVLQGGKVAAWTACCQPGQPVADRIQYCDGTDGTIKVTTACKDALAAFKDKPGLIAAVTKQAEAKCAAAKGGECQQYAGSFPALSAAGAGGQVIPLDNSPAGLENSWRTFCQATPQASIDACVPRPPAPRYHSAGPALLSKPVFLTGRPEGSGGAPPCALPGVFNNNTGKTPFGMDPQAWCGSAFSAGGGTGDQVVWASPQQTDGALSTQAFCCGDGK